MNNFNLNIRNSRKTRKFQQAEFKIVILIKKFKVDYEKIKLIEFQLEQLHMLPLGSELKEQEIQAIVSVNDRGLLE